MDSVPVVDLSTSGDGAHHEFYRVTDATRLADGTIIVANRGSAEVRAYAADGTFAWAFGREGEGPGEFNRLDEIAVFRADSLVAFDYWLSRTTILSTAGALGRVISAFSPEVRFRELYVLDDDTFAVVLYPTGSFVDMGLGPYRMTQAVVQVTAVTGAFVDTVTTFPGFEGFVVPGGDMAPLFTRRGHVAVQRGSILVGTADSMEYRVHAANGAVTQIVRVPGYDLRLSADQVEAERAARIPDTPNLPPGYLDAVAALPSPATRPGYDDMLVDGSGNVWLAGYHGVIEADLPTDWQVFSARGEWLGSVEVPARFTIHEIGVDYVLGVWQDPLDVEHVQLLALHR